MWNRFREDLGKLWQRWRDGARKRRDLEVRARFWDEVHAGQREAEDQSRP